VIDPAQSSAQYAVEEIFFSDNRLFTAVGVTNAVEGEFEVTTDGQPSGKVTRMRVDLRTLKSDSPRRDNAIRRQWLESDKYPYADFVSTDALNLPASYTEGEQVTFTLVGDMTVRDVTKPVEWTVVGTLQGDTVTGEATTTIKMSDFGFAAPDIGGVLKAEDEAALTVACGARDDHHPGRDAALLRLYRGIDCCVSTGALRIAPRPHIPFDPVIACRHLCRRAISL
jgi:polyisoprenoid-binding protein YceI